MLEKHLTKLTSCNDKTFNKLVLEGNFFNLIKGIYNCTEFRKKTRLSSPATCIHHCTGGSRQSNQARKRKDINIGKEELKLFIFAYHMILDFKNPMESIKKLLELTSLIGIFFQQFPDIN